MIRFNTQTRDFLITDSGTEVTKSNNANVWTSFNWKWFSTAMETEISNSRTRIPDPEEIKKMRNNKRTQLYIPIRVNNDAQSLDTPSAPLF